MRSWLTDAHRHDPGVSDHGSRGADEDRWRIDRAGKEQTGKAELLRRRGLAAAPLSPQRCSRKLAGTISLADTPAQFDEIIRADTAALADVFKDSVN